MSAGRAKPDDLDAVWKALGNAFRRSMLDVLKEGPRTTGELADALEENRFVVMQHLKVLRDADLVVVEERGRTCVNHLNTVPIQQIHARWMSGYAEHWAAALVGLKSELESAAQNTAHDKPARTRGKGGR